MFEQQTVKVIIPALNEADSIGRVLAAIPRWADEVIVVDNGSTDATAELAARAGARVIAEPRRGYGRACLAGMAAIDWCDVAVFLDADYSDYPEQMARLVAPVATGRADMVIGSRTRGSAGPGSFTLPQRLGTALACRLMGLLWRRRPSDLGPFRAVRWTSLLALNMTDPTYGWTIEMQIKAARAGAGVLEAPVSYRRRIGRSKISGTVGGVIGAGAKILSTIARHACCPPPVRLAAPERLIVFTRCPLPGRAKTRLVPAIGPLAAADLQRRMAERTLVTARSVAAEGAELEVRYAGGEWRKVRRWLGAGPIFTPQCEGDLGDRMARAFADAFRSGCRKVVIVGTDCPQLTAADIRSALAALDRRDMVLGPSTDGGYWLIGMRRKAEVFAGVHWGSASVMQQTLALAEGAGLSVATGRLLADVDRPEDLQAMPPECPPPDGRPWLSVIVPALDEAGHVERAVASAGCEGAEVIVVDGGSGDGTDRLAEAAGARVIVGRVGRARQMNRGASAASGDVLLFLHADTVLPDGYAERVFDALLDPRVVGGAFRHATDRGGPAMAMLERLIHFRAKYLRLPYGDQALFVRRSAFESAGTFPDVPIAEDLAFVRRLRALGRLVILPAAAVTSARRWEKLGVLRATAVNQLIVAGCRLGVRPGRLAELYRRAWPGALLSG